MSKSMLFLTVLFVIVIGYPYLATISPSILTGGIFEGAAALVVILYAVLKLRGTPDKMHNYSSPGGAKKTKPKKNPFFLDS